MKVIYKVLLRMERSFYLSFSKHYNWGHPVKLYRKRFRSDRTKYILTWSCKVRHCKSFMMIGNSSFKRRMGTFMEGKSVCYFDSLVILCKYSTEYQCLWNYSKNRDMFRFLFHLKGIWLAIVKMNPSLIQQDYSYVSHFHAHEL